MHDLVGRGVLVPREVVGVARDEHVGAARQRGRVDVCVAAVAPAVRRVDLEPLDASRFERARESVADAGDAITRPARVALAQVVDQMCDR